MDKDKNRIWERLSQVEGIMKVNKPVRVKEPKSRTSWEKCVQEHFEKQEREWRKRNDR